MRIVQGAFALAYATMQYGMCDMNLEYEENLDMILDFLAEEEYLVKYTESVPWYER